MKVVLNKIKDYFNSIWWYNHPIYLTYRAIRYDIPEFIRNIWFFRKPLYKFRWWDYSFTLEMFRYCLINMANNLEHRGIEVESSRMKKVGMIKRCVEILTHFKNDDFLELAEKEFGSEIIINHIFKEIENSDYYELVDLESEEQQKINSKIFKRSREIEEEYWTELWDIIKGNQDYKTFDNNIEFNKQFNGTDMRNWWD